MSTDLTFLTKEPGKALRDRFHDLLTDHTRCFDCLVGYFYVGGFFRLYAHREQGTHQPREVILSSVICSEDAS